MKHQFFLLGCIVAFTTFDAASLNHHSISTKIIKTNFMMQDTVIPVKVQLEKTNLKEMNVLFIKDTAVTTEAIKNVLGNGYGELMRFIQQNNLRPMKFMAWYYSTQPPWPVDIAVQTDKLPQQFAGRIQSRIQPGGEVIIAHMWGPYDKVGEAYDQIEDWVIKNNRKVKGHPFEVYVNDPNMVSPAEIQTDIYQPIE